MNFYCFPKRQRNIRHRMTPILSHTGFFVLRSPLYPVDHYSRAWEDGLDSLLTSYPEFKYALYIASKELVQELQRLLENPFALNDKKTTKLKKAIYKYWVRACTRCTPYGLFAGCTLGEIDSHTIIALGNSTDVRQHARLDTDYYTRICQYIQSQPVISQRLPYFVNNAVYKIGNKYRYAEYIIRNNKRRYLLNAIDSTIFIDKIIAAADSGLTIVEMISLIRAVDNTISSEEATAFIQELITSQLLIAGTEPRITGEDNMQHLIAQLADIPEAIAIRQELIALKDLLIQQDYSVDRLADIYTTCEAAFPIALHKDLLQVDMFRPANRCTLSENLLNNILTEVTALLPLTNITGARTPYMQQFIARFKDRYDMQEIPLNIALDVEAGIGFGESATQVIYTPFVEDIAGKSADTPPGVNWSLMQQLALDKYEQALRDHLYAVTLTADDLLKFGTLSDVRMSRSCYLFGSILAADGEAADRGEFLFRMQSLSGPSSSALLGRFCSGDTALAAKVREALAIEAAAFPDAILAEVVHFPEARSANVLIRPVLRDYEIPYIGVSGASFEQQIPVSDLLVSIVNDEVVLRSKRLNKRVIPRLSAAHNYSYNSLPVYRFLCELQQTGAGTLHWDWGVLEHRARLPRVTYQRMILHRASWTLKQKELAHVTTDLSLLTAWINSWRQQQLVPDKVVIAEADNELLLDLTAADSILILADKISKSDMVYLKEFLADNNGGITADQQGDTYVNEVLIPLNYIPLKVSSPVLPRQFHPEISTMPRSFTPGSEWLFLKIYCGPAIAEKLLGGYLAAQLSLWREAKIYEQFFFLRYNDPEPHLRLRFLNTAHPANNDVILRKLQVDLQPYVQSGQVSSIQADTYERELERYGTRTMLLSEQLFFSDSIAVLGILEMLDGTAGEEYRWKLGMRGADILLDDFGLSLVQKKSLLAHLRKVYVAEFGEEKILHRQLNDKYRKYQREINSVMNAADDEINEITPAIDLFRQRSDAVVTIASQIKQWLHGEADTSLMLESLLASYVHMFLNRLFVAKQRKHELVVYYFLEKYYLSQTALAGYNK